MSGKNSPFIENKEISSFTVIAAITENEASSCAHFFNTYAESELPYKKLDTSSWKDLFFSSSPKIKKFLFQATIDHQLVGFSAGCHKPETGDCYVTFVLVAMEYRHRGIGKMLLRALEKCLTKQFAANPLSSKPCRLQITFFNPCALTWLIPGTPGHDHPNAPGVEVASDAYAFFKAMGYSPYVYQNSFYLPLAEYAEPFSISEKKETLLQQGISLEYYDSSKHYGLAELCEDLGNPVWKEELLSNNAQGKNGCPLMAAIRDNTIIGFTGPLRVQESGRGYFAGIGVHSACRGLGLGNVLFHTLCASLKDMGAEFMTLFTGEDNPAGEIYKKAGFKIVKHWADMERIPYI